jgi:hypothetical protein
MIQREQSTTCLKSCKSIACHRACPKSCPQSGACEILKACFIDCVLDIVRHAGGVKFSSKVNGAAQWTGWQWAAAILSKAQVFQQHNLMAQFKDLHFYNWNLDLNWSYVSFSADHISLLHHHYGIYSASDLGRIQDTSKKNSFQRILVTDHGATSRKRCSSIGGVQAKNGGSSILSFTPKNLPSQWTTYKH